MKFNIKIIVLLTVLLLNGCATTGVVTLAAIKEPKKILVVSSMGDDYELKHIGVTIFSNKYKTIDVSDWDIDSMIEEKVSEIKVDDRFQLISQDLSSIKHGMDKLINSNWTGNIAFNGFDRQIFSHASKENFDMILFINSYEAEDPVFFTSLQINGYGLYKRKVFGNASAKYYAISSVSLYDVKTQKKVAGTIKSMSDFTIKYNALKGVDSIDYSSVSEEKTVMFDLLLAGVKHQLIELGIIN